jgi:molybdenum cofactor biosynthesis protein B
MERDFIAVKIAILTISDTRTETDDVSGNTLKDRLLAAGVINRWTLSSLPVVPD